MFPIIIIIIIVHCKIIVQKGRIGIIFSIRSIIQSVSGDMRSVCCHFTDLFQKDGVATVAHFHLKLQTVKETYLKPHLYTFGSKHEQLVWHFELSCQRGWLKCRFTLSVIPLLLKIRKITKFSVALGFYGWMDRQTVTTLEVRNKLPMILHLAFDLHKVPKFSVLFK